MDGIQQSGQRHNNQPSTEKRLRQAAAGNESKRTVDGDGQQKGAAAVDKASTLAMMKAGSGQQSPKWTWTQQPTISKRVVKASSGWQQELVMDRWWGHSTIKKAVRRQWLKMKTKEGWEEEY
jgi:hypothetical protein